MSATLYWPGSSDSTRRHGSLLLAVLLHTGLIAAVLHGLQSTLEHSAPREVVISLLSPSADATPTQVRHPAPTPPAALPRAALPTPPLPTPVAQPSQRAIVQPTAQPMPVVHDIPAPVAVNQLAPFVEPTSAATAPLQELRSVAIASVPAPASTAMASATPAVRGPVMVSGVEYLSPPKVDYPISARRAGLEGKVMLRLLIDEKGLPQRADVQQSSGHLRLDDAARAAAMRALFKPHVEDGHPMPVYALVPISFSLK